MNKYNMTAECVDVQPVKTIGQKGFKKRTFVLCEDKTAEYPKMLAWELKSVNVELVTPAMIGKKLTVEGWPETRAWTDPRTSETRYFTSFTATKVTADKEATVSNEIKSRPHEVTNIYDPVVEDLPF